jgi:hypothetical protein
MIVSINLGVVVGYTINSYLDYYTVPFIVLSIFIVFLIGFPFAADSPKHLMTQNRNEDAIAALKYFRGYTKADQHFSKEFLDEIEVFERHGQESSKNYEKLSLKDFSKCMKIGMSNIQIFDCPFIRVISYSFPGYSYPGFRILTAVGSNWR